MFKRKKPQNCPSHAAVLYNVYPQKNHLAILQIISFFRTPSPGDASRKPSFFQKLFKSEAIKRTASQSPPTSRKPLIAAANKDIPPELMGVSVKELVKVIGESRANGNGVTPPGTPATPKRASR